MISHTLPEGMMQARIDFTVKADDVTDHLIIQRCRSVSDSIKLCRDCSPLSDDEIIDRLVICSGREKTIQNSHFSEMLSGKRAFPQDCIPHLEDICGNIIPTRYLALIRNQELKPRKEAWELEIEQLKKELEMERFRNEAIQDFLRDKGLKI